jgi:small subunit ribosomal protein S7
MKEGRKMSRRGNIAKRDVLADPLYNSKMVTRLINNIMYDGKKGVAQKIVYDAFDIVKEKTGNDPLESFEKALENIMPVLEVKARRVGGSTYQVPMEVRPERRETLGLRWLTTYAAASAPCVSVWPARSWTPSTATATLAKSVRIPTRWQRPTRRLLITDINLCLNF